jgi:hypothetical protein
MWSPYPSGKMEVKVDLKSPAVVRYPTVPIYVYHVFKPKTVKG